MTKPERRFTKRVVIANCIAAWLAIFFSIYEHESQYIAVGGFALITAIVSYYMHIGHKDLIKILENQK